MVANFVTDLLDGCGPSDDLAPDIRAELLRIRDAMAAAGVVVDEPGVDRHSSGKGKPRSKERAP